MKCCREGIRLYHLGILKNKNERVMLSKLRISAYTLAIEGGRYVNIPKHERIYTACNTGEVVVEELFLLNYSLYKLLRQVLVKTSKIQSPMSRP